MSSVSGHFSLFFSMCSVSVFSAAKHSKTTGAPAASNAAAATIATDPSTTTVLAAMHKTVSLNSLNKSVIERVGSSIRGRIVGENGRKFVGMNKNELKIEESWTLYLIPYPLFYPPHFFYISLSISILFLYLSFCLSFYVYSLRGRGIALTRSERGLWLTACAW